MKKYCIIGITFFILISCADSVKQPDPSDETVVNKADSFFPVTSFIKGQILVLDSVPVTPLQVTTVKGKTDSAWIQKKDLKPLLLPFQSPVINETNLTAYFKETRFNDQTLNAITFTYDPIKTIPDSISLRHWDVYVNPETGNVTKVYLVKKIKENNQDLTLQLSWQTNKQAKISTILNKPDGTLELLKEVVFIWDYANMNLPK